MMQGRTVGEAMAANTSREFAELCGLWRVSPWGPERDAWHAAAVCKAIADGRAGAPLNGYPLGDFLVRFAPGDGHGQTPADMRRILRQAAERAGVKVHGDDR